MKMSAAADRLSGMNSTHANQFRFHYVSFCEIHPERTAATHWCTLGSIVGGGKTVGLSAGQNNFELKR